MAEEEEKKTKKKKKQQHHHQHPPPQNPNPNTQFPSFFSSAGAKKPSASASASPRPRPRRRSSRRARRPRWTSSGPARPLGDVNKKLIRGLTGTDMARFKFRKGCLTLYVYAVRRSGAVGFACADDLRRVLEAVVALKDFLDHTAMLALPTQRSIAFAPPPPSPWPTDPPPSSHQVPNSNSLQISLLLLLLLLLLLRFLWSLLNYSPIFEIRRPL
uniref:DUF7851 domain-containing protein n=1 Tax=Ananas comosus var. bracteatus TaxID=296719 RepID=A0A6V7NGL7_ANACO|nr:unnamed protein product [Ananas comosus var. bracteatus]